MLYLASTLPASLALIPVAQLTTRPSLPFNSSILASISPRGILREFSTTPVTYCYGLLLTSRWMGLFKVLYFSKLIVSILIKSPVRSNATYPLMLKYPILNNRLIMSIYLPFYTMMMNSSSGVTKLEMKLETEPFPDIQ